MIKKILTFIFIAILLLPSSNSFAKTKGNNKILVGAERVDSIKTLLKGKKVGLVVNQTSILENKDQAHLLDVLLQEGINVIKVFAPEHGFRGDADAGASINDSKDKKTGISIFSVYGKSKKPSAEQLADLDVVVFDIQDVGARFYTYISTMHYVMEACAEHNKEFIVLDRPNPNDFIDGPVKEADCTSFVGVDPIPLLHGLTVGELALMINGEKWINPTLPKENLKVVKILNWKHGDPYWLPVKPSPNLPNDQAVRLYASLCLFEATNVSVGRGTYFPFQVIGYPDPKFGTFTFTPVSLEGFDRNPLQKNNLCYGIDLREYPFEGGFTLRYFLDFYNKSGDKKALFFSRARFFDLLAGTKKLRFQIVRGDSEAKIRKSWQADLLQYKKMRSKYLLYPDYNKKK